MKTKGYEENKEPKEKNLNFDKKEYVNRVAAASLKKDKLSYLFPKKKEFSGVNYFAVYKYASEADQYLMYISVVIAIGVGLLAPYSISKLAAVYKTMIDYDKDVRNKRNDSQVFLEEIQYFAKSYSVIGFLVLFGIYASTTLTTIAATNQIVRLRSAVLKSGLYQDFEYYDKHADFINRMAHDIEIVEDGIGRNVVLGVASVTAALGCVWLAIAAGWKLALTVLAYMPVDLLLIALTRSLNEYFMRHVSNAIDDLNDYVEDVFSKIRTVFMFNGQQKEMSRYRNARAMITRVSLKRECASALTLGLITSNTYFIYALTFCVAIHLFAVDPDNYDARVMITVFFGVLYSTLFFALSFLVTPNMAAVREAGARLFVLLDSAPAINQLQDLGIKPEGMDGKIELKDVVFRDPHDNMLQNVNLTVKGGQSVALVGARASGQDSVLQLIPRFYDCSGGHVSIDGHDVRELSVRWLRAHIGLVGQEPVLFDTTVRENIRYGRADATDQEIEEAAGKVNAHQFIMGLPQGYNTVIGERGVSLTSGQKQCIVIVRALIRNPAILLVNEPSVPVSPGSEIRTQQAIDAVTQGRTTVTIARKLATAKKSDVIHVFKDGMIVESGKHEELMKKGGRYYDMVTTKELTEIENEEETALDAAESSVDLNRHDEQEAEVPDALGPMDVIRAIQPTPMEWLLLGASFLLSFVVGLGFPILIFNFGFLLGQMSHASIPTIMEQARFVATTCAILGVAMGITNFIKGVCFYYLFERLDAKVKIRMFEFLLQKPMEYFDVHGMKVVSTRLSRCACFLDAVGVLLHQRFQGAGSITLAVVFSLILDWWLTILALMILALLSIAVHYQEELTDDDITPTEQCDKLARAAIRTARTLSFLGQQNKMIEAYEKELIPIMEKKKRLSHFRGLFQGLSLAVLHFMNASVLAYGGDRIVTNGVPYQNLFILTRLLELVFYPIPLMFMFNIKVAKELKNAANILAEMEKKPSIKDPENPAVEPYVASGEIEFNDVDFKYPKQPYMVLRNFNLKIRRGRTLAILGDKGCGKTTLLSMILRFYDPNKGLVMMDDIPLPHLLMSDIRSNIGVVPREAEVFNRTIGENIAYGDPARTPTQEEVELAANAANIHKFIVALPMGYATRLGGTGNIRLSYVEKQKLAIARVILRRPRILLLDDPISATDLDAKDEKELREAISSASAGRTCVVTARDPRAVRGAHSLCLLRSGRALEHGAPDELVAKHTFYHQLYHKND